MTRSSQGLRGRAVREHPPTGACYACGTHAPSSEHASSWPMAAARTCCCCSRSCCWWYWRCCPWWQSGQLCQQVGARVLTPHCWLGVHLKIKGGCWGTGPTCSQPAPGHTSSSLHLGYAHAHVRTYDCTLQPTHTHTRTRAACKLVTGSVACYMTGARACTHSLTQDTRLHTTCTCTHEIHAHTTHTCTHTHMRRLTHAPPHTRTHTRIPHVNAHTTYTRTTHTDTQTPTHLECKLIAGLKSAPDKAVKAVALAHDLRARKQEIRPVLQPVLGRKQGLCCLQPTASHATCCLFKLSIASGRLRAAS